MTGRKYVHDCKLYLAIPNGMLFGTAIVAVLATRPMTDVVRIVDRAAELGIIHEPLGADAITAHMLLDATTA